MSNTLQCLPGNGYKLTTRVAVERSYLFFAICSGGLGFSAVEEQIVPDCVAGLNDLLKNAADR